MNRRILIIDDEPDYLEIYQEILATSGPMSAGNLAIARDPAKDFELNLAKSGDEGLKILEQHLRMNRPIAGVFLNLGSQSTASLEILRRAKGADSNLLFVLTTSQTNPKLDEIERLFGADFSDRWDLIVKPFTQWEILQKANSLVSDWDRRIREREYLHQIQTQQDQLLKTERFAAMGNLARNLGREFGNIIQNIVTRSELALEKKDPSTMTQALQSIVATCEKAAPVVRNLQSLAKTDSKRESLSINSLIKDMVSLLQAEAKKSKVTIVEQCPESEVKILASQHEINQALLNLALNAIQAMQPNGGTLTLQTLLTDEGVSLLVKDTGVGIPEENLPKIFEPLFTTKAGFGTGLGVSATKRIIEAHGGRVSVSSVVGTGTTFTLWLPRK